MKFFGPSEIPAIPPVFKFPFSRFGRRGQGLRENLITMAALKKGAV